MTLILLQRGQVKEKRCIIIKRPFYNIKLRKKRAVDQKNGTSIHGHILEDIVVEGGLVTSINAKPISRQLATSPT